MEDSDLLRGNPAQNSAAAKVDRCFQELNQPLDNPFLIDPVNFSFYRAPILLVKIQGVTIYCVDRLALHEGSSRKEVFAKRITLLRNKAAKRNDSLVPDLNAAKTRFFELENKYFTAVKLVYDFVNEVFSKKTDDPPEDIFRIGYMIAHYDALSIGREVLNKIEPGLYRYLERLDREMTCRGVHIACIQYVYDVNMGLFNDDHPVMTSVKKVGPRPRKYTQEFVDIVLEKAKDPKYQHKDGEPIYSKLIAEFTSSGNLHKYSSHTNHTTSTVKMNSFLKDIISGEFKHREV